MEAVFITSTNVFTNRNDSKHKVWSVSRNVASAPRFHEMNDPIPDLKLGFRQHHRELAQVKSRQAWIRAPMVQWSFAPQGSLQQRL
jgi:hypothetical protein